MTASITAATSVNMEPPDKPPEEATANTAEQDAISEINQKNSPLLRLPGEVRNLIYKYALSDRLIKSRTRYDWLFNEPFAPNVIPALNLSLACRQLYAETYTLTYSYGTFYIPDVDDREYYLEQFDEWTRTGDVTDYVNMGDLDPHDLFQFFVYDRDDLRRTITSVCVECEDLTIRALRLFYQNEDWHYPWDYKFAAPTEHWKISDLKPRAWWHHNDFERLLRGFDALQKVVVKKSAEWDRVKDSFPKMLYPNGQPISFEDVHRYAMREWSGQKWNGRSDIEIIYE